MHDWYSERVSPDYSVGEFGPSGKPDNIDDDPPELIEPPLGHLGVEEAIATTRARQGRALTRRFARQIKRMLNNLERGVSLMTSDAYECACETLDEMKKFFARDSSEGAAVKEATAAFNTIAQSSLHSASVRRGCIELLAALHRSFESRSSQDQLS
jgi:hypothetical protein